MSSTKTKQTYHSETVNGLIREAKSGRQIAYTQLYELYNGFVKSVVNQRIQNTSVAEEIVQDTFIKAFAALDRFEQNSAFGNWLKTIAINTIIDFVRTQQSEKNTFSTNAGAELQVHHKYSKAADHILLDKESMIALKHAIRDLPWRDRRIYNLRFVENLKYAEIAKSLKVSEGTVKSHLHRVRKDLKKKILFN